MESPNTIQNIMTGFPESMGCGVKLSNSAPYPHWNTQTSIPKDAEMDRMFIAIALIGITIDLTCMKMSNDVAIRMKAKARGRLSAIASKLSALYAANPATRSWSFSPVSSLSKSSRSLRMSSTISLESTLVCAPTS